MLATRFDAVTEIWVPYVSWLSLSNTIRCCRSSKRTRLPLTLGATRRRRSSKAGRSTSLQPAGPGLVATPIGNRHSWCRTNACAEIASRSSWSWTLWNSRSRTKTHVKAPDVDLQLAGAHELRLVGFRSGAPQQRLGAGDELLGMERLGQVVVSAHLEADDLVRHLVASSQHDDRHLAQLANLLADGQAVGSGQHDVEDHKVRLDLGEPRHGLRAVPHPLHLIALAGQVQACELDDVLLIV